MGQKQPKFQPQRLQSNLAMAQTRLNLLKNKRTNSIYAKKQEIAVLLREGKEDLALIKVEALINDENYIQAIDILMLYCAQLKERFRVICEQNKPPIDMMRALHTVFYAAPRSQCQELEIIREQLYARYGPQFASSARDNSESLVDLIVVSKLEATLPDQELKVVKLREIAVEAHVEYQPKDEILDQVQNGLSIPQPPSQPGGYGGPDSGGPGMMVPLPQGAYIPAPPGPAPQGAYGPPPDQYMQPPPSMPSAPRLSGMSDASASSASSYQPIPGNQLYPQQPPVSSLDPTAGQMPPPPVVGNPIPPPSAPMPPSAPSSGDSELDDLKARLNNLK